MGWRPFTASVSLLLKLCDIWNTYFPTMTFWNIIYQLKCTCLGIIIQISLKLSCVLVQGTLFPFLPYVLINTQSATLLTTLYEGGVTLTEKHMHWQTGMCRLWWHIHYTPRSPSSHKGMCPLTAPFCSIKHKTVTSRTSRKKSQEINNMVQAPRQTLCLAYLLFFYF